MSEERQKRPPVNIKDLKKDQIDESRRGPLKYMGEQNRNPGGGGLSGIKQKTNLTQLILAVGISVLLFFVIAQFTLTSKNDALVLLDNQRVLETNQATTEADLDTERGRINTLEDNQASFALKSELSGFAKTSDLEDYAKKSELSSLSGSISILNSWKSLTSSNITSLSDRVTDLEEQIEGGVGGSIDYYLVDTELHVKVSRTGYYRFKLTLFETSSDYLVTNSTTEVLEYYTKSHQLDAGEWISGNLDKLGDALESEGLDLSDYQVMLEILAGNVEDVVEDGDSW